MKPYQTYITSCGLGLLLALTAHAADFTGTPVDPSPFEGASASSVSVPPLDSRGNNLGVTRDAWFADSTHMRDSVKTIEWHQGDAPRIRLGLHINTTLILPKGEVIRSFVVGSPLIKIEQDAQLLFKNLLILTPLKAGFDTNLTVFTEKGTIYNFLLFAEDRHAQVPPDLAVYLHKQKTIHSMQWNGSKQPASKASERTGQHITATYDTLSKKEYDYLLEAEGGTLNTHYTMYGDEGISPFGVYDDGTFTYFDYRGNLVSDRLPVVYKVVDGFDAIVNTRFKDGYLIAETLSPEGWTLVNGKQTVCVKPSKDLRDVHGKR